MVLVAATVLLGVEAGQGDQAMEKPREGERVKKLLVGYDGSEPAREAARMAGRLAEKLGAQVTVLTVGQMVSTFGTTIVHTVDVSAFQGVAEEGAAEARAPGVAADGRVLFGEPAQMLLDVADREGFDMVVVGHRGLGGIKALVLGSVAKKVATDASCPVLVVRKAAPEAIRQVLAAIDGSEHAWRALAAAVTLAKAFDARITLLHVLFLPLAEGRHGPAIRRMRRALQLQAGLEALAKASEVCEQAGVDCESMQVEGQPGQLIRSLAQADGYDLVAVGRHGMGRIARLVLGSVSDEVLAKAGPLVLLAGEQAKEVALGPAEESRR